MFKIFATTLYYELLLFFRTRQLLIHSLGFYVIVTLIFPIALSPHPAVLEKFAPGILWVTALLSCLLALENWLGPDLEDQALEQLLLSPHPLPWLMSAKLLAFWLVLIFPLLLITPLLGFLLHLGMGSIFVLELTLLCGTPALIAVGALCKTLVLSLPQQGALLGLLLLPLVLPILIMGVNSLLQFNLHLPLATNLAFLAGISLFSFCCLPLAMAKVLRFGLEGE